MRRSKKLNAMVSLLQRGSSSFGVASSVMLTWLMKTDGNISTEERKILDDFLVQFHLQAEKKLFEEIIDDFDLQCVELASEILSREIDAKGKRLVLDLFLGMIIADGYITFTEIYVIEFIADLFGISPEQLNKIFIEATGRPKLNAGDPSSADWWANRQKKHHKETKGEDHKQRNHRSSSNTNSTTKRQKALAILGLEEGASDQKIKKAFRLLTKIHHPDRYERLGKEAKSSAHHTYIRIKDAYQYLRAS